LSASVLMGSNVR